MLPGMDGEANLSNVLLGNTSRASSRFFDGVEWPDDSRTAQKQDRFFPFYLPFKTFFNTYQEEL